MLGMSFVVSLPAMAVGEAPEGEAVERLLREARGEGVSVDAGLSLEGVDAVGELSRIKIKGREEKQGDERGRRPRWKGINDRNRNI